MTGEHYEVWITLEKWDGDSKIDDVETCKLGNVKDESNARQLFEATQEISMAQLNHLDPAIKIEDD